MILKDYPTISFLDIETTGMSYYKDRIIEVAVIKMENGEEVDRFEQLYNPKFKVSNFILNLTSINQSELDTAPYFEEKHQELLGFLKDSLIVAHNARFDMGFLKAEFKNLGINFNNHYCCSVKLSRQLYPQYKRHNLDSIINRFKFETGVRHRAMYDTEIVKKFVVKTATDFEDTFYSEALKKSISRPHIPATISNNLIDDLPEDPGVYTFEGESYPLYIGMSGNIKRRVTEHLYATTASSKEMKIAQQVKQINYIKTNGLLGAKLREAFLIKSRKPLYNMRLRRESTICIVNKKLNENGYIELEIGRETNVLNHNNITDLIDLSNNVKMTKFILDGIAKKHKLCPALLGLEKANGACFSYHLKMCLGACCGQVTPKEYNELFDGAFKNYMVENWPFKEAVVVSEKGQNGIEEFLIYKWLFIGSNKGDGSNMMLDKINFDRDVYKILKNHLKTINKFTLREVKLSDVNLQEYRYFNLK